MKNRTFRDAMGKFATGVTIVTTKVNDQTHGMTANAFMSVSLDPQLITISIDNNAKMLDYIKESGKFAVSILKDEQKEVSMHFAGQKDNPDVVSFDEVYGIPIIQDSLASVICEVDKSVEAGDHTLFIGEVLELKLTDGSPLAFFSGKYGSYQVV